MGFWNWFGGTMDEGDDESVEQRAGDDPTDAADGTDPGTDAGGVAGPDVVEIEHRVGELEDELKQNGGRIESVQHSQEEVAERVEEMNETVRDLLGIYERLTADVNPFTDGEEGANGFGVVSGSGEHADATDAGTDTRDDEGETAEDATAAAEADESAADVTGDGHSPFDEPDDGDDVFTFDDAMADLEARADPAEPADDDTVEAAVGDAAPGGDGGDSTPSERAAGQRNRSGEPADRTPYLTALAGGYATDVLTLEWLAELVETTGPAATLKAIAYYEDIGWIGPSVAATLEEYLAGPGIDVHVDPNEPSELCVEDHVTSYEYILKLDAIRELEHTV